MHADEQIDVQETKTETEADIDLEISAPSADPAEGANQTIDAEDLTDAELRFAYRVAVRSRVMEEYFVRAVNRGDVKFSIWGPGEEIHGAATALALSKVCELGKIGMILHYRNAPRTQPGVPVGQTPARPPLPTCRRIEPQPLGGLGRQLALFPGPFLNLAPQASCLRPLASHQQHVSQRQHRCPVSRADLQNPLQARGRRVIFLQRNLGQRPPAPCFRVVQGRWT